MSLTMTRRTFGALLGASAGGVLLGTRSAGGEDSGSATEVVYPFGALIYSEPPRPLDQLRADAAILKRLGFNMVRVQASWAPGEPREGDVSLEGVHKVVSDARQIGLKVILGVTMAEVPAWLWRKFPDAETACAAAFAPCGAAPCALPSQGRRAPCWHHPGAREAAMRFLREVGRQLSRFDNIVLWSVGAGSSPHSAGAPAPHNGPCACPHTLTAYRAWLRSRYETLALVNQAWRTSYADWDEIIPPCEPLAQPTTIDWRRFVDVVSSEQALALQVQALRESDLARRPVMAHVDGLTIGGTRDWGIASAVDVYGACVRPDESGPFWSAILMALDYARSASRGRPLWVAELQGGPIAEALNIRHTPEPPDIRRWVLSSLAAGARGLCFSSHRAELLWSQGYGLGLLDSTGETTARVEEAGRIARALQQHAELFTRGATPEPEVAIIVSEDLRHFAELSGDQVGQRLASSLKGVYRALWDEAIPAAFLPTETLSDSVGRYRALILPFPLALGGAVIEILRRFVATGGTLVSEACPGRFDPYGFGSDGEMPAALAELFGARHTGLALLRAPGERAVGDPEDPRARDGLDYRELVGAGAFTAHSVSPSYYLETFAVTNAVPILKDGEAVTGCAVTFGKGRAYLIGTLLGEGALLRRDGRNGRFLAALLATAGVAPDRVGRLVRRRRVLGRQAAWFLFNNSDLAVEERVPAEGREPLDLLGDKLIVEEGQVRLRFGPREARCLLLV